MNSFKLCSVPKYGIETDEIKRNTLTLEVFNNVIDFSNIIGTYDKIRVKSFKKGLTIITKVDDDMTRIKSIIKGTITKIKNNNYCYSLFILLNNNITVEIRCRKYHGINNIIEVKEPMWLLHTSFEPDYNKDILAHVGEPFNVSKFFNDYFISRDYYYLSNGSKRLD